MSEHAPYPYDFDDYEIWRVTTIWCWTYLHVAIHYASYDQWDEARLHLMEGQNYFTASVNFLYDHLSQLYVEPPPSELSDDEIFDAWMRVATRME